MSGKAPILVVDDDPAVVSLLQALLSREGYQVEGAANAQECFARISGGTPPRAILLDIMLPGISGFEALERLKGAGETSKIPVIIVSTLTESSYAKKAKRLGAEDFLTKPFESARLLASLKSVLSADA